MFTMAVAASDTDSSHVIKTPKGLKHYQYARWLAQTLEQLSQQHDSNACLHVEVHVPQTLIAAMGEKRFDRLMQKTLSERLFNGHKRYPNIARIDVQEWQAPQQQGLWSFAPVV